MVRPTMSCNSLAAIDFSGCDLSNQNGASCDCMIQKWFLRGKFYARAVCKALDSRWCNIWPFIIASSIYKCRDTHKNIYPPAARPCQVHIELDIEYILYSYPPAANYRDLLGDIARG